MQQSRHVERGGAAAYDRYISPGKRPQIVMLRTVGDEFSRQMRKSLRHLLKVAEADRNDDALGSQRLLVIECRRNSFDERSRAVTFLSSRSGMKLF